MEKDNSKYWRIDVTNPHHESDGYSLCVKTDKNETDDTIIDLCLENEYIDKFEYNNFYIHAEEITNDPYEMEHWQNDANEV